MSAPPPSLSFSTTIVLLLTALWGYVRLYLFQETLIPLTFVLPLLICVWTGRRWQLWTMAAGFSVMAVAKLLWILPLGDGHPSLDQGIFLGTTLFNILVGAVVVHLIIGFRERLETRNAIISAQNAELEAQAEELSQQNEEIKAQSEELAEQNEEIEAQTEEVTRQNEDLIDLNSRLTGREEILQGFLHSTRERHSIGHALDALCARALTNIGAPAAAVAILERHGDSLEVRSQAMLKGVDALPKTWPVRGSIAEIVLVENRTTYVSDLDQRTDLAQPFAGPRAFRSLLATPLALSGDSAGLFVVGSVRPGHWTDEQFHIVEWIAAQCALMLETLQNQKALAEHAQELEAANQSKDRFLAMLSHELRTPLTPVLAAAGALENDDRLPDDVREDFQMIRRNVGIQSRLVDDLLDLTRISRGKIELDRQVVLAVPLLRDAVRIVAGEIDAKSQSIDLALEGLNGHAILGDGPRLQQVFWNLLKNAGKFSPPTARIEVRGRCEDGQIVVEVSDPGDGIAPEDAEQVFLPFEQRLAGPRRASENGLGLGLAIAKAVVEMHGGSIAAQSKGRGCGTTVVVKLPLTETHPEDQANGAATSFDQSPVPERPSRILLVEDHGDTGRTLARLLRRSGYDVQHAETAAAALALFQESRFDLVVSDVGLPDETGLKMMERIRTLQPDIPGICMTGYGMEEDIAESRRAGFREHLTKPVDVTRLKAAISRALSVERTETGVA